MQQNERFTETPLCIAASGTPWLVKETCNGQKGWEQVVKGVPQNNQV